jgi:hypothetical protein
VAEVLKRGPADRRGLGLQPGDLILSIDRTELTEKTNLARLLNNKAGEAVLLEVTSNPADPKAKRKDRWLFEWPPHDWFGIAGLVRLDPKLGEAFTLLTCPPGPDIAPYHNRQIVLLTPEDCLGWLDPAREASNFIGPLPGGNLRVTRNP